MNKFKGKIICCDVDGTLIDSRLKLPPKNTEAVNYFHNEGGLFTLATGRTVDGLRLYLDKISPDLPMVVQNGAAIYDLQKNKYIWYTELSRDSAEIIDHIVSLYPETGVEIMTTGPIYSCRDSDAVKGHEADEHFTMIRRPYSEIPEPWLKAVFAAEPPLTDEIQNYLEKHEFSKKYHMARSYPTYYEFFDNKVSKAFAVRELAKIINCDLSDIIVIGDNDNDAEMLALPECRSFCPSSASEKAKASAKTVLSSSNDDGVLAEVISLLG